jgi:Kelch motif
MMPSATQRYDIANDTWTAYDDLDIKYHVSDLAGFVGPNGLAYFVGGYNLTYAAQSTVFTINPVKSTETGVLEVAERASLPTARGDLSAVVAVDQSGNDYALATGGFTNENNFCEPLAVAERYNFTSDTWSEAAELKTAVGDQALVVLNNRIFALAGERQIANICLVSPDDPPDPGEETVPIDDVEWYDAASSTWTLIEDLPHHRFRFAAIGYHDKIYSFGGQLAYANSCQCFKTSDEVIVYTLSYEAINKTTSTSGAAVTSKLAALLLAFVGALFI